MKFREKFKTFTIVGLLCALSAQTVFAATREETVNAVTITSNGKIVYDSMVIDSKDILKNAKDIAGIKYDLSQTQTGFNNQLRQDLEATKTELNTKITSNTTAINGIKTDLNSVVFVKSYDSTTKTLTLSKGKPAATP